MAVRPLCRGGLAPRAYRVGDDSQRGAIASAVDPEGRTAGEGTGDDRILARTGTRHLVRRAARPRRPTAAPARGEGRAGPRQPCSGRRTGRPRPAVPPVHVRRARPVPDARVPRPCLHGGRDRPRPPGPRRPPRAHPRHRGPARPLAPPRERRHRGRRLRPQRARRGLGRGGAVPACGTGPPAGRRTLRLAAHRGEVLDLQRPRGRLLHRVRPHHPRRRRPRRHRLPRARRPSRPHRQRARHALAAPRRRPLLRRRARHRGRRPGRTGRGLPGGHGHPQPVPPQRRRLRRRHGAGRPRRDPRAHHRPRRLRRHAARPPGRLPPGRRNGPAHRGGTPDGVRGGDGVRRGRPGRPEARRDGEAPRHRDRPVRRRPRRPAPRRPRPAPRPPP